MLSNVTRIMTVSLESQTRHKAYAVYDGEKIGISYCIAITGPMSKWQQELNDEIIKKSEEGFIVLVEDKTGLFCVGDSSQFSFEEMSDGRSMLFHSLDWYYAMYSMGQILADKDVERFMIRGGAEGQKIERSQDDRGRTVYKVDWNSINGGQKAVLMCVAGAMMQPLSDRFLAAMYGNFDNSDEEKDHLSTWETITKGVDERKIKEWNDYYDD